MTKRKKPVSKKKKKAPKQKKIEKGWPDWSDAPPGTWELPGGINNPNNWDPYSGHKP